VVQVIIHPYVLDLRSLGPRLGHRALGMHLVSPLL
jgi:hypothetical protein